MCTPWLVDIIARFFEKDDILENRKIDIIPLFISIFIGFGIFLRCMISKSFAFIHFQVPPKGGFPVVFGFIEDPADRSGAVFLNNRGELGASFLGRFFRRALVVEKQGLIPELDHRGQKAGVDRILPFLIMEAEKDFIIQGIVGARRFKIIRVIFYQAPVFGF